MLFFCDVYLINMHRINIFGGEKGIVKCVDRGWSVVIPPKFSDQLSWKWRQQTSKSAMFLASLSCLKNDRSTSSSYFTAQWSHIVKLRKPEDRPKISRSFVIDIDDQPSLYLKLSVLLNCYMSGKLSVRLNFKALLTGQARLPNPCSR